MNCAVRLRNKNHIYVYEPDHIGEEDSESEDDPEWEVARQFGGDGENVAISDEEEESGVECEPNETGREPEIENGDLEPEEGDEEQVFIMHSCQNERKNHMVTKSQPQSLKFPVTFKPAIEKVI